VKLSGALLSIDGSANGSSLPAALPGKLMRVTMSAGDLTVYVAGEGPPMLLIHSINAAASAAEVRPLHQHFRHTRTVFSVDLPGYGLSARSDLPYSPALMTEAIEATVGLIRHMCGSVPIDALALSLSCEFLARAAAATPAAFRSLALVSPTGFRGTAPLRGPPGSTRGMVWLYRLLRGPGRGWGRWVFRQLTRPGVIRYFLERTWGSKAIDEALWQYDILATRVPGAEFAPLRFLSGYLFSADIHAVYGELQLPVWMSHGIRGDFTDYRNQKIVANRANWRFTTFPTGALPHFEVPALFFSNYERFLGDAAAASPASDVPA
jgi:hypothetical protein